jgi:uncharacterized membrane protein
MNDENIKKMIEWVESSSSFIQGQIPDYIEQLLRYKMISTWVNIGILSVLVIVCSSLCIWCVWKGSTYEKSYDIPALIFVGSFIPGMFSLITAIGLISEIQDLIRLYIAPKVYVLNHLTGLIKG